MVKMKVGILSLQGDFAEHYRVFEELGANPRYVKIPEELEMVDGVVIPGGESTTLHRLLTRYGIFEALKDFARKGKPLFGTCAGLILLAREVISEEKGFSLELLDIVVARNAYGRQRESFETPVKVNIGGVEKEVPGVFIRAPKILETGSDVEVLGKIEEEPVLVREGNIIGATFHPELTEDSTVHKFFLDLIEGA
jgi:5'-phosphate synthase pdxT subunit